jgi:hypothetical protein
MYDSAINHRLSYDRYTDPWPGAEPPDPDDLDAACDAALAVPSAEPSDRASCALRRERARRSGWGRGVRLRTPARAG